MGLTPRDHTRSVLSRMQLAGSVPGNINRTNDMQADNYGLASARSSDASSFKNDGAPKSPHMGRPGRQAGGRIAGDLVRTRRTPEETARDIASEDEDINRLAKDREGRARGGRAHSDEAEDRALVGRMVKPGALTGEKRGGRIGRAYGGSAGTRGQYSQTGEIYENRDASGADKSRGLYPFGDPTQPARYDQFLRGDDRAEGGRVNRAHGGRTKGKTTVVIIGGQKAMSPPPAAPPMPPPPMAPPGPVGPPRPPPGAIPGPAAGGMPVGGAPLGAAGAPPPGVAPMLRARGGRVSKQLGGAVVPQQGAIQNPAVQQALRQRAAQLTQQQLAQQAAAQQMPPMPGNIGGPILRAKGGRIEIGTPGVHTYPEPQHGKVAEEYGAGSGLGRQERARRQK